MPSCRAERGACAVSHMLLPLGRAVPTEKLVGYSQTTFLAPCDGVGTEKGCRNPLKHSSALQGCHERAKASGKNRPHTHLAVHSEPRACIKVQLIQGRNAGLGSGPARQLGRTRPELWAGAVCPKASLTMFTIASSSYGRELGDFENV